MKIKMFACLMVLAFIAMPRSTFANGWEVSASDVGRFSILMPGTPGHKPDSTEWVLSNETDDIAYYLTYSDLNSDDSRADKTILDASVKGMVNSDKDVKIISKSYMTYKGNSAVEIHFSKGELLLTFCSIVVKHRFYTEGYSAVKSKYDEKDAQKYLTSLKFIHPELNTGTGSQATQQTKEETGPTLEAGKPIVSEEGRFSITMPYKATLDKKENSWTGGNKEDTVAYSFTYSDLAANSSASNKDILDAGISGALKSSNSTLMAKQYFQYQGFDSCEYEITTADFHFLCHNYVVNHRLYVAVYTANKGLYNTGNARKFFKSLIFIKPELNKGE